MLALAFSFLLFLYWSVVGRALLAVSVPRFGVLRAWLVAPGIGLATTLLGTTVINQAGVPLDVGTWPLTLTLGLAAVAVLARTRREGHLSIRAARPFLAAVVAAMLWTGWPALSAGFDWISYGNDDMANYCLAAERFRTHGFYAVPTMAELSGRDYASFYFFMHVSDMMRFGAEHMVAWAAGLARITATAAFMPTILALAAAQVCGAAGLALHAGRHRRRALLAAWLLAASPLFMLGSLYQLIAQAGGIALLLATLALMTRRWGTTRRSDVIRHSIPCAVAGAGLCLFYPETTPFAVVAYLGYHLLMVLRGQLAWSVSLALTAYTLLGVLLLLRHNLISYLYCLVKQLTSAIGSTNPYLSLFPYFLLPTGFANLFGWMPVAKDFAEPWASVATAAGMAALAVVVVRAVREGWRMHPAALLLLVQTAVAVKFFTSASDFNLYKLAMWMQPALAIGIAGLALKSGRAAAGMVVLLALTTAPTALHYTRAALGLTSGGMTELRYASKTGLAITPPADVEAQITATIENVVAAKFAAGELRGHQLTFLSREYFSSNTGVNFRDPPETIRFQPHFDEMAQALPLNIERLRNWQHTRMLWQTEFVEPVLMRPTDYYVSPAGQLSLFNKFGRDRTAPVTAVFQLRPAAETRNELVFVHSGLGNHYYLGDRTRISFFQQEPDPYAPGQDFNGLGRFLLLRVERPSEKIYLRIAATRSLLTDGTAWQPHAKSPAVVHASEDHPIGIVGHGAFNLLVGPLTPYAVGGSNYVAIDFKEVPRVILDQRAGMKRLYNQEVPLDYRRLIGWARDISAIGEEDYARLDRPRLVSNFPHDLTQAKGLEFSGAYEDGWLSPDVKFILAGAGAGELLRVRGTVPSIPGTALGTGTLRITINGAEPIELPAAAGTFDWLIPITRFGKRTEVRFNFSASAPLPGIDRRPVGAQLTRLELLSSMPLTAFDFSTPGQTRPAAVGVDADGWFGQRVGIRLTGSSAPTLVRLKFEVPDWGGGKPLDLKMAIDGKPAGEHRLAAGAYHSLTTTMPASSTPQVLEIATDSTFALPAPDTRSRSARLLGIEILGNQ